MRPDDDINYFHDEQWDGDITNILGFWEEQGIYFKESFKKTPIASMAANLRAYEATTGQAVGYAPGVGFMPVGIREPVNKFTKEQWEQSPYYRDNIDFYKMSVGDGTVTEKMAQLVAESKDEEQIVADLLSSASQNTTLGNIIKWPTMFAAQLMDPLNVMTSMVPIFGEAKYMSLVEKLGKLGRIGAKSAQIASNRYVSAGVRGAVDGMVGNAIVEPVIWSAAAELQEEYNYIDSLINVGFGAVLGGTLKVIGVGSKDFYTFARKVFKHTPDEVNLIINNGVRNLTTGEGVDIDTSIKIIEKTNTLKREPDTPKYSVGPDNKPVLTREGLDRWRKTGVPEELLDGTRWDSSGPPSEGVPPRALPEWVLGLSDVIARIVGFLPDEDKHLGTIILSIIRRGQATDVEAVALKRSTFLRDIVNAHGDNYTNEQLSKDILHLFHKLLLSDEQLQARAVKVQQEVQGVLADAENLEMQRALREADESSALFSDPEEAAYYESIIADEEARMRGEFYDEVLNDGTIHPEELPTDLSQIHSDQPQVDRLGDDIYSGVEHHVDVRPPEPQSVGGAEPHVGDIIPADPQAIHVQGPSSVGDPPIGPLPYAPESPMAKWVAATGETPSDKVMPKVDKQATITTIDETNIYTFTNNIALNIKKMLQDMANVRKLLPKENFRYFHAQLEKYKISVEDLAMLRTKLIEDWVVLDLRQLRSKYEAITGTLVDIRTGMSSTEFLPVEIDTSGIAHTKRLNWSLINEYTQRLEFLRKQYPGENPINIAQRVINEYHEKDIANLRGHMYSLLRRIEGSRFIKKYMSKGKIEDLIDDNLELMAKAIIAKTGFDVRKGGEIPPKAAKYIADLKKSTGIDLVESMRPSKASKGPTEVEALKAFLLGVTRTREGAGLSLDYLAKANGNKLAGQLENDLMQAYPELNLIKKKLYKLAKSENPELTKAIANEMWNAYYEPGDIRIKDTQNPTAKVLAAIYKKYQDKVIRRLNELGAHIKERSHYIIKQTHDRIKLQRAGFDQWYENTISRLDIEKTFGNDIEITPFELKDNPHFTIEDKIRGFMEEIYNNLIVGRYQPSMFDSPTHQGGLTSRLSKSRELIFKSADDFLAYNDVFGTKSTIFESMFRSLNEAGKNIAMLEKLGHDPHAALDDMINDVINSINKSFTRSSKEATRRLTKLEKSKERLHKMLAVVDGTSMVPDNVKFAKVMASIRQVEDMAKLGGVWLSSLMDAPVANAELMYNGVSYDKSITSKLDYVFNNFEKGVDKLEFARLMGLGLEHLNTELVNRFTIPSGVRGAFSWMHSRFFEWNLLQAWTDGIKNSTGITLSAHVGKSLKQYDYGTLLKKNAALANALRRYGITEKEWAVLRKVKLDAGDMLMPEAISKLSDADVKSIVLDKFNFVNKKSSYEIKIDLENKYRVYLLDRVDAAVPTPGGWERLAAYSDTRPGTILGETLRAIMQFKSYGITYTRKVFGREFRMSKDNFIKNTGHWLVRLALPSLFISAGVGWAKDLIISGKKPRKYWDLRYPRNLITLVMQSGIGGIAADFILGMQKGYGVGIFDSALGPTASTVRDIGSIGYDIAVTAASKRKKFGRDTRLMKKTWDTTKSILPYNNLFYTKLVLDYSIFYSLEESLDPGASRRKERSLKKRTGQEYWAGPRKRLKPLK